MAYRFEYKVVVIDSTAKAIEELLNEMAEAHWEFVAFNNSFLIFCRFRDESRDEDFGLPRIPALPELTDESK